jgi:signal peptidase I
LIGANWATLDRHRTGVPTRAGGAERAVTAQPMGPPTDCVDGQPKVASARGQAGRRREGTIMLQAAPPTRSMSRSGLLWLALLGSIAVILVPVTRIFVVQPFNVPSTSMEPTLMMGDYFMVAKYAYGYSRYSFPFSPPLFEGRIFGAEPERGDLIVFRLPKDDTVDYVKRVVGLPGERIQMRNGELYINGARVKRGRVADFVYSSDGKSMSIKRWRETLPNGVSYETLDMIENGFLDNTPEYVVPAGHYFMLGDNRDNSTDSRVLSQVGYVPFANLIGRVDKVFMSIDPDTRMIRFDRMGLPLH